MINDIVLVVNGCLECSWLPWQHVDIMNTTSVAQLWTPSPSPPAPSPEGCTNSDGRSDWARTILPCYLSMGMAEWSVTGPMVCQCHRWVLVIWTPPGPDLLPQTPWPSPAPDPHPPISTHRPQPPPAEADRWHYVMRWWAPGETRLCYPGSCLGECVGMV